jgi:acetyl esterase/lipase
LQDIAMTNPATSPAEALFEVREDIEFAQHDGVRLAGTLYRPRGAGPHPVVVGVHGGGWQLGEASRYRYWGEWLAARGVALFAVTYRLSTPGRKSYPGCLHDVRAAVQFVRGRAADLKLAPDRIALMGDSAGGHLAALVALAGDRPEFATAYPGDAHAGVSTRVKVVIPVYGVFDLYQQWQHDLVARPRDSIVEKLLGVSAADDKHAYFNASPLSWVSAKDNTTAFLVVWGTRDDTVDYRTQSEAFMLALKQSGHFARPVVIEGAPHFWVWEPVDEPGTANNFLAPRLLRFLEQRL